MINVLNHGLNFCILTIKQDITKIIWSELWYGKETTEEDKIVSKNEKLLTQIKLLTVCLFVDPNYPNHPNHPDYPNYPNHLGLF